MGGVAKSSNFFVNKFSGVFSRIISKVPLFIPI
jgi:hypothetical protein